MEEEEIIHGMLPFVVGGEPKLVPELKWRANREWQVKIQATFDTLAADSSTPEGQVAFGDAERELVLAYDVTGALGDLEDATIREIDSIYDRLVEISFPFGQRARAVVATMVRRAIESALDSSSSSPSQPGTTVVSMTSKRRSPTDKHNSSTGRRRTG